MEKELEEVERDYKEFRKEVEEEENKARSICGRGSEKKKMFVEATSL